MKICVFIGLIFICGNTIADPFFKDHQLVLFYSSTCHYCQQFAPIIEKWSQTNVVFYPFYLIHSLFASGMERPVASSFACALLSNLVSRFRLPPFNERESDSIRHPFRGSTHNLLCVLLGRIQRGNRMRGAMTAMIVEVEQKNRAKTKPNQKDLFPRTLAERRCRRASNAQSSRRCCQRFLRLACFSPKGLINNSR